MFWAGFLTCLALLGMAGGVVVFLTFRAATRSEPLSREETERLAAKVRDALERQASLSIYKPSDELPSTLIGRN